MIHAWTVFCRGVSVDKDSNTVSLFDVVEQFAVVPSMTSEAAKSLLDHGNFFGPVFALVSLWARDSFDSPESGRARISVISPNGQEQQVAEYEVNLRDFPRSRHIFRMVGFPCETAGQHWIDVGQQSQDQWVRVAHIPVHIEFPAPSPPATAFPIPHDAN